MQTVSVDFLIFLWQFGADPSTLVQVDCSNPDEWLAPDEPNGSWNAAQQRCGLEDAKLVVPANAVENDQIAQMTYVAGGSQQGVRAWIGYTDEQVFKKSQKLEEP